MNKDIGTTQTPQDQPFGNVSGERSDSCTHGSYSLGIKGEAIVHFCTRCKQTWPMGAPLPRGKSQITWPKIGDKITLTRTDGEPAYDYVGSGGYVDTLALSSADSSGSDNVPLPSGSGEQPTSVEPVTVTKRPFKIPDHPYWVTVDSQVLVDFHGIIAEERRQAKIEGGIEAIYDLLDTTGDFPIKVEEALAKVAELKLELKEGENTSEHNGL